MQRQVMDVFNDNSNLLCRTCLQDTDVSVEIFSERDPSILQMLTAVTRIKLAAGDLLPQKVCKECQRQIIHCYNFKLLCEHSDSTLWELARKNNENTQDLDNGTALVECKEDCPSTQADELSDSVETVHNNLFQVAKWHYCDHPLSLESDATSHVQACHSEVPVDPITENDNNTSQDVNNLETNPMHGDDSVVDSDSAVVDLEVEPVFLNPNFRCPQCGRIFRSASDVRRHEATHDPRKPYNCTVGRCKWSFASQAALLVHGQVNHGPGGAALACRQCGKTYRHARSLRQHLQNHAYPHRFTCHHCNKGFKLKHHLTAHESTHSKEKPFLCQQCGARFATKERLHLHTRRHDIELRQHSCLACPKTFLTAYELRLHASVHFEERAYMCAECGRQFRSKRSLARHHARHTTATTTTAAPLTNQEQTPQYECGICKKNLRKARALERHMTTHLAQKKVVQKRGGHLADSRSDPSPPEASHSPPAVSPSPPAVSPSLHAEGPSPLAEGPSIPAAGPYPPAVSPSPPSAGLCPPAVGPSLPAASPGVFEDAIIVVPADK